ncbi:MAG TPA: peptidylprolyl isomerase [Acidobacteriaceae bacterium]|jgi:hypothetical protein
MRVRGHNPTGIRCTGRIASLALALVLLPLPVAAGQGTSVPAPATGDRVSLDRVVAVVNGDLILASDVDAERRFTAFQPFAESKPPTEDELLNRLIDRTLVQQQMALQPLTPIPDIAVDGELAVLRKSIPKCAAYHCDTDEGWRKFAADQGFDMQELRDRWRLRMEVLQFIEDRFRMGIRIQPTDIDAYYQKTMLPVYAKEKMTPPPESTLTDRIQEILLQQQVDKLLDDWLASLRAQGSVRILKPGEEAS